MFPNCIDRFGVKKEKQKYNKQTKKNQGKKSTNKKWESLSEEWIGRRS